MIMGLLTYAISRIVTAIIMIFLLFSMVFVILHILPGDPAVAMLPEQAPPEAIEKLREELGLNKPLYVQYFDYLHRILRGDLGVSWYTHRPVINEILYALPATVELSILGMTIGVALGIAFGIISSLKRGKLPDHIIRVFTLIYYSMPIFWLGPMFQLVFGLYIGVAPIQGRISTGLIPTRITGLLVLDSVLAGDIRALVSTLHHLLLPAVILGIYLGTTIGRITRGELINVLREDYIVTARAKGLTEKEIVYSHALRNALLPVLTVIGLQFATLLGGLIILETVFNFPGMGSLLIISLNSRDFPLLQGVLVFSSIWVGTITILVDIVYSLIDPRIKR